MLLFAATTGASAGEQWATRWRDVDLDDGALNISRRVDVKLLQNNVLGPIQVTLIT
jgi:integrase